MSQLEKKIEKEILLKVGGHPDIVCWPNDVGTARALQPPHQHISYGKKGSGDLVGIIYPFGIHFDIEVKTGIGTQRQSQKDYENATTAKGSIYIIGRNADEALHDLLMARVRFCEKWGLQHLVNYETLEVDAYGKC